MRKISILAFICYTIFAGIIAFALVLAWIGTIVSHGTVMSNFMDGIQTALRARAELAVFFLLPIAGYLFQKRYNRLRSGATDNERINEFLFKRKNLKRTAIITGAILLLYPVTIFTLLLSAKGLHQIPYAYVGTINTVRERFPPYHLLLFSEKVEEVIVVYDVWLKPSSNRGSWELDGDISRIAKQLNIPCSISNMDPVTLNRLPDHRLVIDCSGRGSKEVVLDYLEREVDKLPAIEKVERRGPGWYRERGLEEHPLYMKPKPGD